MAANDPDMDEAKPTFWGLLWKWGWRVVCVLFTFWVLLSIDEAHRGLSVVALASGAFILGIWAKVTQIAVETRAMYQDIQRLKERSEMLYSEIRDAREQIGDVQIDLDSASKDIGPGESF